MQQQVYMWQILPSKWPYLQVTSIATNLEEARINAKAYLRNFNDGQYANEEKYFEALDGEPTWIGEVPGFVDVASAGL